MTETKLHRILIVDDERRVVEAATAALTRAGHQVRHAPDVTTAVGLLRAHGFDLVLAEVLLAPATGIDLARSLKSIVPDVPIILMTGYGNMELAAGAVRAGATAFLLKPFTANELRMAVDDAISRRGRSPSSTPPVPADGVPEVFKRAWGVQQATMKE